MAVQNSTRKWVFIGVGVIAAAALVVFFQNYPPQPKDAAATIGAAQRYHSTQITGADVKVSQDELTTWIQSDTFDRIVKDPEARKLFTDAAVINMFADNAQRLNADGMRKLDADGMRKQTDDMRKQSDGMRKLDADGMRKQTDDMRKQSDDMRKLDADGMRKQTDDMRKQSDDMRKQADGMRKLDADSLRTLALDNAAIRDALMNQAFCQALLNQALRDGLVNQARIADTSGRPE